MFFTIYKTINLINNKFYIGKHQTRNLLDGYMGSGKCLKYAIKKYGIENFHKEILFVCSSEKEMNLIERILVVPDAEINYNLCSGGQGGFGYINLKMTSDDYRNLGRKGGAVSTKYLPSYKSQTRYRKLMGEGVKRYQEAYGHPFKGKKHTESAKRKIGGKNKEKQQGEKNSQFGTCWMTDGKNNAKVRKELVDEFTENGYYKGRTNTFKQDII